MFVRHVRGEPSAQLLYWKAGRLRRSGRGLSFWFTPLGASLAEVPLDDREIPLLFHGRSSDFQAVTVQGVVTYRVASPDVTAERVDFAVDTRTGLHRRQPLEKITLAITELAGAEIGRAPLRAALDAGDGLRDVVHAGLVGDASVAALGLEIVATRISSVKPTPEMEKALQMPAREKIQEQADEATFSRRALAVEKERAIQENELTSRIELSRREEQLIEQEGANARRRATEGAEARRIDVEASAAAVRVAAEAEAARIHLVEDANVGAERDRMAIYRDLPESALYGLAARELASNLHTIEHLSLGQEAIGPMLGRLARAGAASLEAGAERSSGA
jgi:regulator of protease activity HflC (stomatin/prohibitin superfamily)